MLYTLNELPSINLVRWRGGGVRSGAPPIPPPVTPQKMGKKWSPELISKPSIGSWWSHGGLGEVAALETP